MEKKCVLVAGASGLVGHAAIRKFASSPGWRVYGVSRRKPALPAGATHFPLDLNDGDACQKIVAEMPGVTHLVYAAVHEQPSLFSGWLEKEQMQTNQRMLENLFEPLTEMASGLCHVTLLQGTKAYGAHLGDLKAPARENQPRHEHENFYWLQEDYIRSKRREADWTFTILRPQIIFGPNLGVAMNLVPAIGVYAALLKEEDVPLYFPGGAPVVLEAVDADLLAEAIAWAAEAPAAQDEIFNVTNGDVFVWQNVWPTIANVLGMEPGPNRPQSLAQTMPPRANDWQQIVRKYHLTAPDLDSFVGLGFQYADFCFAYGAETPPPPVLVSTVKIRSAGFHSYMVTEDMFVKWFRHLQNDRLLPPA